VKKQRKSSAIDRRQFLAATGGLLAAAVPGAAKIADVVATAAPPPSSPAGKPAGSLRKIPIGVFDPVYEKLSLDAMLDKVSARACVKFEPDCVVSLSSRCFPFP